LESIISYKIKHFPVKLQGQGLKLCYCNFWSVFSDLKKKSYCQGQGHHFSLLLFINDLLKNECLCNTTYS